MKILVFSDSHGDSWGMLRAIRVHHDADFIIFLGDGLSDLDEIISSPAVPKIYAVYGNCDTSHFLGTERVPSIYDLSLLGKKIVFTHGNLYDVKYSTEKLVELALHTSANLVLFGHTHLADESYRPVGERGVYFFNPGSISRRYGTGSYGIITLTERGILLSHGKI